MKDLQGAESHLEPVVFRRARHVISEIERTLTAARAIQAKDWTAVGELMYASHESLRNDYEVSCLELDAVVEIARDMKDKGIIGARMTGAGFGGCAVCLARTDTVRNVTKLIDQAYEKATGEQAEIFSSRPASGARVISG
jgi:galactokinase